MPTSSPKERLLEFTRLFLDRKYEEAFVLVEELAAEYPNEGPILWQRARALEKLERYDEARVAVKRVLEVRRDFAPALVMRAALGEEDDSYDPEPDLSRAIELDPRQHEALAARAGWRRIAALTDEVEGKRVHLEGALADFDRAIAVAPLPNYRFARADLLQLLGRDDEALAEFDRLLAAMPEDHSLRELAIEARSRSETVEEPRRVEGLEHAEESGRVEGSEHVEGSGPVEESEHVEASGSPDTPREPGFLGRLARWRSKS